MIQKLSRTIDVWTLGRIKVEKEGQTLSVAIAMPNAPVQPVLLNAEIARQLITVLEQATALPVSQDPVLDLERSGL